MTQYDIKTPIEASIKEIFFDRNTNKLSFKNDYGIITALGAGGSLGTALEGNNYLFVNSDGTPIENGQAVLDAYVAAQAMTPNGVAKSATNRVVILLAPGYYDFNEAVLGDWYIDQSFIDFESLSGVADVYFSSIQLISSGTGKNIRISGIDTTKNSFYTTGPFAVACSGGVNESIYIKDCVGGDYSFVTYSSGFKGTIDNCVAGNYSFGYLSDAAPGGNVFVGGNTQLYGTFKNCIAGNYSFLSSQSTSGGFGTLTNTGIIDNCRAGTNSFMYSLGDGIDNSGTIRNCQSSGIKSFCVADTAYSVFNFGLIIGCTGTGESFVHGRGFATPANIGRIIDCVATSNNCFVYNPDFPTQCYNSGSIINCSAQNSNIAFCGPIGDISGFISNCIALSNAFCCDSATTISGEIHRCTLLNDTFTVGITAPGGRVVLGIDTSGIKTY